MGIKDILSIFNLKEKLQEVFSKANVAIVKQLIKAEIIKQVKANIPGQEKMDKVVDSVVEFIKNKIHSDNKIVQWIIDTFIINNIRPIAQSIYEDLKELVDGLTIKE